MALHKIHHYRKSTELLIHKSPFAILVREITQDLTQNIHFQSDSMRTLQKASEAFLVSISKSGYYHTMLLC